MSQIFNYKARDKDGRLVKGTLEAESSSDLVDKLQKQGYFIINFRAAGLPNLDLTEFFDKFSLITDTEKLMFYIQFANLINSGLPILGSLKILSSQISNRKFKLVLESISHQIEAGANLSDALNNHTEVFPQLLVHMARAGETSGTMANVLLKFSQFAEQDFDLRQRVKTALFYPGLLSLASAGLIVFITSFVVPNFVTIFQKAKVALPLPTRILYWLGLTIRGYWLECIIVVLILLFVLKWFINTVRGRFYWDNLKLKLPFLGLIFRQLSISRFSRTLATMEASGVPILKSLEVSKEVMGNVVIAKSIAASYKLVEEGSMLSESLKITNQFPQDILQMISAGEQSGNLSGMLFKLSDYYDKLIDYRLRRLIAIIEPLFLVVIGSIVAFIMVSMLLPLFDMIKVVRAMRR